MKQLERLMQNLPTDIDVAILTAPCNRRYFTGFASSAGTLFVTKEQAYFIIDSRYFEAAKAAVRGCEVLLQERLGEQLGALCQKHGVKTAAAENSYLTLTKFEQLRKLIFPVCLSDDAALDGVILRQRSLKTPDEVALIRAAQKLTDDTFTQILDFIRPGRTEREIALEMEFFMRLAGAEGVAFDFIVASGENSSKPHAVPGERVVCVGDFVTMDFGARVQGYCSDMTRTVAVGAVTDEQRRLYDTVLAAQLAGLAAARPGVACAEVDAAARDLIDGAGYRNCFGHGLGHSLGVEIHEQPACNSVSEDVLEPGVMMTVEPGIYLEGRFGCRIEDMLLITESGAENLTASPKNLIVL